MALNIAETSILKREIIGLDLNNPKDRKLYNEKRDEYFKTGEGIRYSAYDDATSSKVISGKPIVGNVTIGIGFNMGADHGNGIGRKKGAKDEWHNAFKHSVTKPNFDDVFYGRAILNSDEVEILFHYSVTIREEKLNIYYGNAWGKFKPNEKLAITDLFYNAETLVTGNSNFAIEMKEYTKTGDKQFLNNALWEIRYNSNKKDKETGKRSIGLQRRRESQAELLNSYGVDISKIPTPSYYKDGAKRSAEEGRKQIEGIIKQMFELRKGKISRMLDTHKQMLLSDIKRQTGRVVDFREPKLGQQAALLEEKYALMLIRYDEFLQQDINDIIDGLMSEGQTPEEIKAVLTEYFIEQPRRISELEENFAIVLRQKMDKERQQLIGIGKYMWVTTGDDKVRSAHAANSGQIFFWKKPPATGNPGDDYNCRCQARPVV